MEGNNLLLRNNNFNNPLLSPSVNTFELEEFNLPLSNNNNNLLSEELDSNVAALVNAFIGMNLTEGYFSKKESFIKLIKFEETEIEDSNKWLERFNRIAETNQ